MRLRHHTSVSIAGGKICVWPQAERRSFPTIKLDMSQLVHASATFSVWRAAGSLQKAQLSMFIVMETACILTHRTYTEYISRV